MFLSGIEMGVNIVCTLFFTGNHDRSISKVAKCKIKSCMAHCAISVTLPFSSRGASSMTSLTIYDVSNVNPCLVPLGYLSAIYWSFKYPFSE